MVPFLGVTNTNLWGAEGFTPVNPSAYGPGRKPSWLQYTPCIVTQCLFLVCCQWSRGRIVQAFRYLASVIYAVFHSSQFRVSLFNLLTFFCFTPRPTCGGGIVFELFVRAAVCLSVNSFVRRDISLFSEGISTKLAADIQREWKELKRFSGSKIKGQGQVVGFHW